MLTKRIISVLLAAVMLMGALVITVSAQGEGSSAPTYTYNTSSAQPAYDYLKGQTIVEEDEDSEVEVTPVTIDTKKKKLRTMDLRLEKDGYQLYVDAYSGEVAIKNIATEEILFTNPYDAGLSTVGGKDVDKTIKEQLLSQIVVKYTNITTGTQDTFYSFSECIQGENDENPYPESQITVKNIKNGIRVEYSIGREEARMLVPQMIEKESFETKILSQLRLAVEDPDIPFGQWDYDKFMSFYLYADLDEAVNDEARSTMEKKYPITRKMDVWILDTNGKKTANKARLEQTIKMYAPDYTYEDLDEDHLLTEYESEDENPPLFKMALEYTLDKQGVSVRLPANGIRFNETLYQLDSVEILPYMGAGKNPNTGKTFFPDGSGTLFDFEKINALGTATTISGKLYGNDYAYHDKSNFITHQEVIRYPVFGLYESEGSSSAPSDGESGTDTAVAAHNRGFLAIVEEGDALMELSAYHAVRTQPYNTVKLTVYPRPKDTYNLADAISVGSNDTWTVVSSRKYTGSYKIRYIMLTDDAVAADKEVEDYYSSNYVGMAKAYREYLENAGVLSRLTSEDVRSDIPVYIKTFGAVETTKRILSIPVSTMAPLTTFEDIKTMYGELNEEGVKNINFILSGYTKGGLSSPSYPGKLKWEKSVGGADGFADLVQYSKNEGTEFGIFPDFDFVFISNNTLSDGVSLKKHAVKTIDNRYTSRRVYSATKQTFISYFELAMSPAYYSNFYEKLTENYSKYEPIGISVSTLGSYLNSDFDEDEPYNREDSKEFTVAAFKYLDENYSKVMTSGGNAYSWKYVDYITDISLDSSRYAQAAASIPFLGMVLHGYVEFAGTPINMEGNTRYALLKAIENGASINFTLSYQNTDILKESVTLSQYYSVRYDIWFNDLVSLYNELNALLKDVQTSLIVNHQFVDGERVPDNDELLNDARKQLEDAIQLEKDIAAENDKEAKDKLLAERKNISAQIEAMKTANANAKDKQNRMLLQLDTLQTRLDAYNAVLAEFKHASNKAEDSKKLYEELNQLFADMKTYKASTVEYAVAKAGLDDAKAALETYTAEYNLLAAESAALTDELKALNTELALLKKADPIDQAAIDAKQSEVDAKAVELNAKRTEAAAKKTQMDDQYKIVHEYSAVIAITELPPERDALLAQRTADRNNAQAALAAAKAELEALKAATPVDEAAVAAKEAEVAALEATFKSAEDDVKALTATIVEGDAAESAIKYQQILLSNAKSQSKADDEALATKTTAKDKELKSLQTVIDGIYTNANLAIEQIYNIKPALDAANASLEYLKEFSSFDQTILDGLAKNIEDATAAYVISDAVINKIVSDVEATYEAVKDVEGVVVEAYVKPEIPEVVAPEEEPPVVKTPEEDHTYDSDEYKIALVEYENGKKFLLNFNNYDVTTKYNGVVYTITAYGYVLI